MPVSPTDVARLRHDNEVVKIVESFDRRLVDPKRDSEELRFKFHKGTSPSVVTSVEREYRLAGWVTNLAKDGEGEEIVHTLDLSERPIRKSNTADAHDPQTLHDQAWKRSWARRVLSVEDCLGKDYSPCAKFIEVSPDGPKPFSGSAVHTSKPFTVVGRAVAPRVTDQEDIDFVLPKLQARAFYDMLRQEEEFTLAAFLTIDPIPPVLNQCYSATRHYKPLVDRIPTVTATDTALMKRDHLAARLTVSADGVSMMRSWGREFFDEASARDRIMNGLMGQYLAADVFVCNAMPAHLFMHTTIPGEVGSFYVIKKPTLSDYQVLEDGSLCVECEEEIAVIISNPDGICVGTLNPFPGQEAEVVDY